MRTSFNALLLFVLFGSGCHSFQPDQILTTALSSEDPRIQMVMQNPDRYGLQVRYTQIDRDADLVHFSDFDFQVEETEYFYPASTVKFPIAVATLEKLNQLDTLSAQTAYFVEGDTVVTTFAKTIEEIFAVSSNEASNRLVEFLGFDDLNARIQARGVRPIRISHRLSTPDADNVVSKPLIIYKDDSTAQLTKSIVGTTAQPLQLNQITKGRGYYQNGVLIDEPFDFSMKNYFPVTSQSNLLKRIIFPENFNQTERFNLSETARNLLLQAMSGRPKDFGYDPIEYYDSYGKFFIFGDSKDSIPPHIKIFNKVGYAYGTLTDCAYIKDEQNHVEFMLIATLLVNANDIFNDDTYEFDEIGIPFLAQLGREIYELELKRTHR